MKLIKSKPIFDIFSKSEKIAKKETEPKPKIIIDYREKNSLVASYLISLGFDVEFKELKIGDYAVKDTIIERKTISDFISSMINGRLLKQLEELKQFENKLLIIEGISKQEIYADENSGVNANAIRGFLLSILLKHKIPIMFQKIQKILQNLLMSCQEKKQKMLNLMQGKKHLIKKNRCNSSLKVFRVLDQKAQKNF